MSDQGASATAQLLKKVSKKKVSEEVKQSTTDDFLLTTAHQIENLTEEQAFSAVEQLLDKQGEDDFRLGGLLATIQSHGWFGGYASFKEMVQTKYGLHYRKAMYLIQIYTDLVKNQIPWEKVKGLGWTKLKEIAPILTQENVDEWVAKALVLTVLQLQEAVKAHLNKGTDADEGDTITSTVTTMTFKVHQDQKETIRSALDKAKAEAGTEFDTVALEAICIGYLGGATDVNASEVSKPTLKDLMKGMSPEDVLMVFEQCFPEINLTVEA